MPLLPSAHISLTVEPLTTNSTRAILGREIHISHNRQKQVQGLFPPLVNHFFQESQIQEISSTASRLFYQMCVLPLVAVNARLCLK